LGEGGREDQVEKQLQGAHPQRDATAYQVAWGPVKRATRRFARCRAGRPAGWRAGRLVGWWVGRGGHGAAGQEPGDGSWACVAASAMAWRYQPPRLRLAA